MFNQARMDQMTELQEKYSKVKNWTRTEHKNVDKFYEALGLEHEQDSTNKKIAINCYEGEWMIKTSSQHYQHSTQVWALSLTRHSNSEETYFLLAAFTL